MPSLSGPCLTSFRRRSALVGDFLSITSRRDLLPNETLIHPSHQNGYLGRHQAWRLRGHHRVIIVTHHKLDQVLIIPNFPARTATPSAA